MENEHTKEFNKSSSVLEESGRTQSDGIAASNIIERVRRELTDNAEGKKTRGNEKEGKEINLVKLIMALNLKLN